MRILTRAPPLSKDGEQDATGTNIPSCRTQHAEASKSRRMQWVYVDLLFRGMESLGGWGNSRKHWKNLGLSRWASPAFWKNSRGMFEEALLLLLLMLLLLLPPPATCGIVSVCGEIGL
jgi:hypothetical protein